MAAPIVPGARPPLPPPQPVATPASQTGLFSSLMNFAKSTISSVGQQLSTAHNQVVSSTKQMLVSTVANTLVLNPAKMQQNKKILQAHGGSPQLEQSIKLVTDGIVNLVKDKLPKELADNLPTALEGLMTTALANIAEASTANHNGQGSIPHLLSDVINHLVSIVHKHAQGGHGKPPYFIQLKVIEQLPTKALRDIALVKLFTPMHQDLIKVAFKNGVDDYGFTFPLKQIAQWVLSLLEDPANMVTLYSCVVDSLCNAEDRTKQLNATIGGKVLLQAAEVTAAKTPGQLLSYLSFRCTENTLLSTPLIGPLTKAQQEQEESRKRLSAQIGFAADNTPAPLVEFSGTLIHSAVTKLFLHFAEHRVEERVVGGQPTCAVVHVPLGNEDPLNRIFEHVKTPLRKFYREQSPALKIRYRQFCKDMDALNRLEATPPYADPQKEADRQNQIKVVKESLDDWYKSPAREQLTTGAFKPLSDILLKATGFDQTSGLMLDFNPFISKLLESVNSSKVVMLMNGALRLAGKAPIAIDPKVDAANLNRKIMQEIIPYGLQCLLELGLTYYPQLLEFADPEEAVREKADTLDTATNSTAYSAFAKSAAQAIMEKLAPDFIKSNSADWGNLIMDKIDTLLPTNLNCSNAMFAPNKLLLSIMAEEALKNIAGRPKNDQIKEFLCAHIEEAILDVLIKNCSGPNSNPLVNIVNDLLKTLHTFHTVEGPKLAAEYEKLPANPSPHDLDILYAQFQQPFEALFNAALAQTGLDKLLDAGKLTVFGLNSGIRPKLIRQLFDLYLPCSLISPVPVDSHDVLCAALYDKDRFLKKLADGTTANGNMAQIYAQMADPNGKTPQQRRALWDASGTSAEAETLLQASNLISDLIGNAVLPMLQGHGTTIGSALTSKLSLQNPQAEAVLLETVNALADGQSSVFNLFWPVAQDCLFTTMPLMFANTLKSTPAVIPRPKDEHHPLSLVGDLATRVCQVAGDCMKMIGQKKQEIAGLKADIAMLQGIAGQTQQISLLTDRLRAIYKAATDPIIAIIKTNGKQNDPLHRLPIPENLKARCWDILIPEKLGEALISIHTSMNPAVQPLQDELFDIYNSNHLMEICRYASRCVSEATPYHLRTNHDTLGSQIFGIIDGLLKPFASGPGQSLYNELTKNKDAIQKMFSHTLGMLGANKDRDGVMKEFVWPFIEEYSFPLILSIAVKFSKQIQAFQQNDPDYMVKCLTGFLKISAKYFKKLNEITIKSGKTAAYELSSSQVFKDFGADLHPALQISPNASPEEIRELRMQHVYRPFMKDILEFLNFKADDIHAPENLKKSLFSILENQLGPMSIELMTGIFFKEDGKEATLDKLEENLLNNMQIALNALDKYTAAVENTTAPIPQAKPAAAQLTTDKLLRQCAELLHELVQMIPDYFTQKLLSLNTVKKMTASQLASVLKQICKDWPPTKIVDVISEKTLPAICSGEWRGIGKNKKFVPESRDIRFDETEIEKRRRLAVDVQRARENKNQMAKIATDGIFIMIKLFFQNILSKIDQAILTGCVKAFGKKFGKTLHDAIVFVFSHIGMLLGWVISPIVYIANWIVYTFIMKDYSAYAHRNLKHQAHINFIFEVLKFTGKSVRDEAASLRNPRQAAPVTTAPAAA